MLKHKTFYFGRFTLLKCKRRRLAHIKQLRCKRRRLAHIKPLRQCVKMSYRVSGDDPFSRLSDDVIATHILSRLPLKEAVKTSVLSHRWQKLWTGSIGSKLIFLGRHWYRGRLIRIGGSLARGISRILELARPTLDELTVSFDFSSSSKYHHTCDRWVEIALRKGVTRLQLDFSPDSGPPHDPNNYPFPDIDKLSVYWPAVGARANNLREVCLKSINISGEVLQFLLSNCPSLESLCVWKSYLRDSSDDISISTQSSKLKTLEFFYCYYPEIVISAPNLVSLFFMGDALGLRLEHTPLLSELHLSGTYCRPFLQSVAPVFRHISELKKLTLDLYPQLMKESIRFPLEFPELIKLEQLEINFRAYRGSSLLWLLILIKAAPFLQKLSMKMAVSCYSVSNYDSDTENPEEDGFRENILNTVDQVQLQCLKLIEMQKFKGHLEHLELGQHLLGMAQSLEQLIVAPFVEDTRKELKNYRELAKEFHRWLPPAAKLVIL